MFKKTLLFTLFAVVVVLSARAQEKTIRFGATLALTGGAAPMAQACQRGAELAIQDINSEGGISGAKVELIVEDFQETNLTLAASAAQKLAGVDKVAVLFTNWSEDAEVVAPIAEAHGIISMTLGAGGPRAARFSDFSFRATTSDGELARLSVQAEHKAQATRGCIFTSDTGYYVDITKEIIAELERQKGTVAYKDSLPYGTTDVKATVTRARNAGCESLYVWTAPETMQALISELIRQKNKTRRVLPWFGDVPEVLELTRHDAAIYTLYKWQFKDRNFIKRYEEMFKSAFMRPAGNCYDGVRLIARIINEVGTDQSKIRKALLGTKDYVGVTGPFHILADRERTGETAAAYSIVEGKLLRTSTDE